MVGHGVCIGCCEGDRAMKSQSSVGGDDVRCLSGIAQHVSETQAFYIVWKSDRFAPIGHPDVTPVICFCANGRV